jgi:hypothetical protein
MIVFFFLQFFYQLLRKGIRCEDVEAAHDLNYNTYLVAQNIPHWKIGDHSNYLLVLWSLSVIPGDDAE